jgi:hypothetical protein
MPQGPITRIVLRRPNGSTEIIGRVGHIDHNAAARTFATRGQVVTVRHETMPQQGASRTVAIHNVKR